SIEELSIVGLPDDSGGEIVACLCRCKDREKISEHFRQVSAKLPVYKRVKVLHFTDLELPKTATRKVKRKLVVEEIQKRERLKQKGEAIRKRAGGEDRSWMHEILSAVSGKPRDKVSSHAQLAELGFDSLMYTELGVALEAAGVAVPENADLTGVATVE